MTFKSRLDIPIAASGNQSGAKRDTAELCRERAAADLLASTAMINAHQRARMETSAAVWTQRAEMLQRFEEFSSIKRGVAQFRQRIIAVGRGQHAFHDLGHSAERIAPAGLLVGFLGARIVERAVI